MDNYRRTDIDQEIQEYFAKVQEDALPRMSGCSKRKEEFLCDGLPPLMPASAI